MSDSQSATFPNTTTPLQRIIPAYLYQNYNSDQNLQAFVSSYNLLAQSYLDWFNVTPLSVYTSPSISGPLLDWVGLGIYGIPRPVLSTATTQRIAGYAAYPYNTLAYADLSYMVSGTATLASDDIYKRVLTWNLYRGDAQQFSIFWLKRRVSRFLNGANGTDAPVLNTPPSVTVSGSAYTITVPSSSAATALQQCIGSGSLNLPFQYTFTVVT